MTGHLTCVKTTFVNIFKAKPGEFATVMKPLVDPGPGQVRIRVEASGACHSID
jgi:propanol-preferring alcohol dehydrogenase